MINGHAGAIDLCGSLALRVSSSPAISDIMVESLVFALQPPVAARAILPQKGRQRESKRRRSPGSLHSPNVLNWTTGGWY
jgi:hypothetical protein